MLSPSNWPHRWFGFWKEDGPEYRACPSLSQWPSEALAQNEMARILTFLRGGAVVCVTQVGVRNCVLCGRRLSGSRECLSDGLWLWPGELAHYLEEHGVAVPLPLRKHIELSPAPDANRQVDPAQLEWPEDESGKP